ncbi:hypothetical protein EJ04DRAFT_602863 [Polyplosphaeria fusca]|uniref:Uncharacterized protein n=1 Tax=Polyplosphaeria fusca TaxID=682080 RepID=A0A9P4R0P6_9PLEO|nr:hypothetical protein EJ04DRAFT_602863 [Polyplosphaeria fusca]
MGAAGRRSLTDSNAGREGRLQVGSACLPRRAAAAAAGLQAGGGRWRSLAGCWSPLPAAPRPRPRPPSLPGCPACCAARVELRRPTGAKRAHGRSCLGKQSSRCSFSRGCGGHPLDKGATRGKGAHLDWRSPVPMMADWVDWRAGGSPVAGIPLPPPPAARMRGCEERTGCKGVTHSDLDLRCLPAVRHTAHRAVSATT